MNVYEAGIEAGMEKVAIRRSTAVSAHEEALKRYDAFSRKSGVGMTDDQLLGHMKKRRMARSQAADLHQAIGMRDAKRGWVGRTQPDWSKEKPPVHVPRQPAGMSGKAKAALVGAGVVGAGLVARHVLKKRREKKEQEQS